MRIIFLFVAAHLCTTAYSQAPTAKSTVIKIRVYEISKMKTLQDRPNAKWISTNLLATIDSVNLKIKIYSKVKQSFDIVEYEGSETVKTGIFHAMSVRDAEGQKARILWYIILKPINEQAGTIFVEYGSQVTGYRYK